MRPTTRRWVFALLAIACLLGASTRVGSLNEVRETQELTLPPVPETVRPSMLLTPMLALGRAPLVDYLWMRATKLKDDGRYFDAYQLSSMICELQPHFATVWGFQGWNMAYNISVTRKSYEERWRWVRNGFELIRDQGIPLNPHNMQLYRELSWIFFHKVGDFMDEAHWYYKNQFAMLVEDILGPPPDDFVRQGVVRGDYYRNYDFRPLARAPEKFGDIVTESLLATYLANPQKGEVDPEWLSKVTPEQVRAVIESERSEDPDKDYVDPAVESFVAELKKFGFDAGKPGVLIGVIAGLRDGSLELPDVPQGERETRMVALRTFMASEETRGARTAIEHYWRSRRVTKELHLEYSHILALEKQFEIRFDYRLAETHSLYWATLGLERAVDEHRRIDTHRLNTARVENFCLKNMFQRGRMAMSANAKMGEPPLLQPDLRFFPVLFKALHDTSQEYLAFEQPGKPVSENFKTSIVGFTRLAVLWYDQYGQRDQALKYFEYLKENYPDPMYDQGIDVFLTRQFAQDVELNNYAIANKRVETLVHRAVQALAYDEDDSGMRFLNTALDVYNTYQASVVNQAQKFQIGFRDLLVEILNRYSGTMYRPTYLRVCGKLNIAPLPERSGTPNEVASTP